MGTTGRYLAIGMDVGSTTVKAVVMDPSSCEILWSDYQRHHTKQPEKVLELLLAILTAFPDHPKDAYRISIGLNIGGLVDGAPHERALIALRRRRTELALAEARGRQARRSAQLEESRLDTLRSIHAEELALRLDVVRFHAMLFEQGKGGFDDLVRAKLALLGARRSSLLALRSAELPEEER